MVFIDDHIQNLLTAVCNYLTEKGACENDTDPDTGLCDDEECIYCKMAKASVPVFKEMDRG